MAKQPAERYETCGELAAALQQAAIEAQAGYPTEFPEGTQPMMPAPLAPAPPTPRAATIATPTPAAESADTAAAAPTSPSAPPAETVAAAPRSRSPLGAIALIGALLVVVLLVAVVLLAGIRRHRIATFQTATAAAGATRVAEQQQTAAAAPTAQPQAAAGGLPFRDTFDGQPLNPRWTWINEPQRWEANGALTLPVEPSSGLDENARRQASIPALVTPISVPRWRATVDLSFSPTANYQSAGLVVLSGRRLPLFSLTRTYCDNRPNCAGDALYFRNWAPQLLNRGVTGMSAAGGVLPSPGRVNLMLVLTDFDIQAYYRGGDSPDAWKQVGSFPLTELGTERVGYVGLITGSGGQQAPATLATFDDFTLTEDGPPN